MYCNHKNAMPARMQAVWNILASTYTCIDSCLQGLGIAFNQEFIACYMIGNKIDLVKE